MSNGGKFALTLTSRIYRGWHEVTEGSLNAEFKHRNLLLSTGRREPPPPTMSFSKNLELRITHLHKVIHRIPRRN